VTWEPFALPDFGWINELREQEQQNLPQRGLVADRKNKMFFHAAAVSRDGKMESKTTG
jgi:hypothetical protein